ncbi:hypothetical protein DPMN_069324 [Dreissena polymorpha]|uniref:Uncharacterized protein n=1 Tax=Dreissena polymorpha TaxID=45954 RepID=A0A9D3Z458_DREPO|nr:hypothetical protein DPMN_069324 [Dreissena polymorpha]
MYQYFCDTEYVVRLKGSKDMTSLSEELDSVTMEISCNNSEGFNNEARLTFSFKEIPVKGETLLVAFVVTALLVFVTL